MIVTSSEISIVSEQLRKAEINFAFVGGLTLQFHLDEPQLSELRPTDDLDVVVGVTSLIESDRLDEVLRKLGFEHDTTERAPRCRWNFKGITIDIMPSVDDFSGMNNRWFREALASALDRQISEGCQAKIISPALFLATKIEAFKDRGKDDFVASVDMEDIVTLLAGRRSIVEDVKKADPAVGRFIAGELSIMARSPDFLDSLEGHFAIHRNALEKQRIVLERISMF